MDAADINKIMERFEKTGVIIDPTGQERKPMYGDFTEIKDYHTQLSAIRNVERAFGLLPANVRNRFNNDPQTLINWLEDPKNNKEAVDLGLKSYDVLLTSFADDGVTRITQEERDNRDKAKLAQASPAPVQPPAA
jgi:phage internal scaffolding protein